MKWFLRNLQTFLLAFSLAIIVWVSAVNTSDPTVTRDYPQPIPLEVVGLNPSLVVVGELPQSINVSLMAPISVWNTLGKDAGEVRAILDLSGLKAGQHSLKIQPQITIRPVQIMQLSVESVNLTLEEQASIKMPLAVVLRGEPAVGYKAGTAKLDVNTVTITGPRSLIDKARKATIELGIDGMREDWKQDVAVAVLDERNFVLQGLSVSPNKIQVVQPIVQMGGYRDVAVKVNIRGQQAGGYRITNISVYPPVVTVYSQNPAVIADMPGYVETEPFNLNGENADIIMSLPLVLPTGVEVTGDQTVRVQVGIAAIEGSLTLKGLPVEIIGLEKDLVAAFSPNTVDLIITGPVPLLDSLKSGDIKIMIDLTGLEIGTHQLNPQVQIAINDIKVQNINPATIEINITKAGATPTP